MNPQYLRPACNHQAEPTLRANGNPAGDHDLSRPPIAGAATAVRGATLEQARRGTMRPFVCVGARTGSSPSADLELGFTLKMPLVRTDCLDFPEWTFKFSKSRLWLPMMGASPKGWMLRSSCGPISRRTYISIGSFRLFIVIAAKDPDLQHELQENLRRVWRGLVRMEESHVVWDGHWWGKACCSGRL